MILVESVFDSEMEPILQRLVLFDEGKTFNRRYCRGVIGRNEIICISGILGKVESAFVTQKMVDDFHPDCVFLLSGAGAISPDLKPGDLILGEAYKEYDRVLHSEFSIPLITGNIEFVYKLRSEYPSIKSGVIISGDELLMDSHKKNKLYLEFGAMAMDMDSAAVAAVCRANKVSFVALKVILDNCCEGAKEEFNRNFELYSQLPASFFAKYIEKNYLSIEFKKEKNREGV